jgi:hypothetical protein
MSTKTNFKRVALVAVASLGLGVLTSVAPANAAIAAGDLDFTTATGSVNTGTCAISNTTSATAATALNGSLVKIKQAASITDAVYLSISGPATLESFTAASATFTPTTLTDSATAANDVYNIRLTGLGTVTVTYAASSTSAATDVLTITSVAACAGGTFSAADSNVTIVDVLEADSDSTEGAAWTSAFNGIDTSGEDVQVNAGTAYIRAALNDGYGADLASKAMIATSTTGCNVGLANTTTSAPSISTTSATAVLASTGADVVVAITQSTAGAPASCTISLSWNGINVATKSVKIQGNAASVTVSDVTVGARSGYGYYRVTVKDANGNLLPSKSITASSTEANNAAAASIVSNAASNSASTSSTADATYGKTPATTSTTIGNNTTARYTCTSKGGAAKITVRALVSGVTYVTSAPFDVYCGGTSIDTWSISMDKASYAPGEIATLTVTAKDADGFLAQSLLALGTLEYSFGGLTAVTAPSSADLFNSAAGSKKYTFSVGTSEGAFVGTFKLTGTTDTSAKTIQYKVAGSAGVTNADVLKAIVSLIASINKQIAALQKALLKR